MRIRGKLRDSAENCLENLFLFFYISLSLSLFPSLPHCLSLSLPLSLSLSLSCFSNSIHLFILIYPFLILSFFSHIFLFCIYSSLLCLCVFAFFVSLNALIYFLQLSHSLSAPLSLFSLYLLVFLPLYIFTVITVLVIADYIITKHLSAIIRYIDILLEMQYTCSPQNIMDKPPQRGIV